MSKNIFLSCRKMPLFNRLCATMYRWVCCYLWLMLVGNNAQAQAEAVLLPDGRLETPYTSIMTGITPSGGIKAWSTGGFITTIPPRQNETSRRFRNVVSFYVNEENTTHYLNDFTATVTLQIQYKAQYTNASYDTVTQTLALVYKKGEGVLSDVRKYISFEGAEEVKVTVTSFAFPTPVGGLDYRNILKLENTVYAAREYTLSSAPFVLSNTTIPGGSDVLNATWAPPTNPGHNAIQLEWGWLENELEYNYHISGSFNATSKERFLNSSATRVELGHSATGYAIPMLYGGAGKLHHRVRGVSIQSNGTRIYGPWSAIQSANYSGHEASLNWQVTTSFAEEGKRKTVIQYYDGSLRPRQTVTKDNTSLNIVTAETLYDHEGRPAIQILPAPGISNIIAYQKNLNLFNSPGAGIPAQGINQNHADYFDHYFDATLRTPSLQNSINGSTAKYYSAANPAAGGEGKYIPDAEGYPYTVTHYTPDGTGRIQAQSGVGAAFKMGSGHETKYYYGSPKQEELDALFGTEVGDKGHYFKNMVQDANGQMSVSYVDMHGRTIATALAGESPAALTALNISDATMYPNQNHTSALTMNLLDKNTNVVKGNAIESVSSLLVPYRTLYTFNYTLTPESLNLPSCPPAGAICYECLYDLEFVITDESGGRDTAVLTRKYTNLSPTFDSLCSTTTRLFAPVNNLTGPRTATISFTDTLPAGSYLIRKTLTISEKSVEEFKAHYLTRRNCELDFQHIFDSVYLSIKNITQCDEPPPPNPVAVDCADCRTQLGDSATFRLNYLNKIGISPSVNTYNTLINFAFKAARDNCDLLCGKVVLQTRAIREMMLADMKPPFGQYAKLPVSGTMAVKYNIFSTTGTTPPRPLYRNPRKHDNTGPGPYLNEQGLPDASIDHLLTATAEEFTKLFRDSWAPSLLPYHPEYHRLLYAESKLDSSYKWEKVFNNITTYSAAQTAGFIFINASGLQAKDPFFGIDSINYLVNRRSKMQGILMTNYVGGLSMWQYAYSMAMCKKSPVPAACTPPSSMPEPSFSGLSTADKDSVWKAFKGLYLQVRREMMNEYVSYIRPLSPVSDTATLVAQGYFLHFPRSNKEMIKQLENNPNDSTDWSFWPESPGNPPVLPPGTGGAAWQQQQYTSQCESYVAMWKTSLQQCPALKVHANATAILNSLTARMVQICRKGSDEANPSGSSSVAPATPNDGSFRNFETLIQHVLDSLSIPKAEWCNPFVIEFPKPYGMNRKPIPATTTAVDSCHCSRFTTLKAEAVTNGKNPNVLSSLNQYLHTQYGDTLTLPLFNALQRCNELNTPLSVDCDTIYLTITAPCDAIDPCGNIMPYKGGPAVLKMGNDGNPVLTTQTERTNDLIIERCRPGFVWDPILMQCVPDFNPFCMDGLTWDPILQMCTGPGNCPPGYTWDYWQNRCVIASPPLECEFNCPTTKHCDTTYLQAVPLATPAPLPDFLHCGYTSVQKCYTCTDIKTLIGTFKTYFPSPVNQPPYSGVSNMSAEQVNRMQNLARYLNYKTGMQYTWAEYMQAVDSSGCNLTAGGTQRVLCRNTRPLSDPGDVFTDPDPCQSTYDMAMGIAQQVYNYRISWQLKDMEEKYRAKCMDAARLESFTVTYRPKEYHYTLYYYDQAGNLVKTVPPAGVRPDYSTTFLNDIKAKRAAGVYRKAPHVLTTEYRYNSLNQVVAQKSPDGGTSLFWYDKLGRLAVSRNAQQTATGRYSYTQYDVLGRITEVGQKVSSTAMTQTTSQNPTALQNWITGTGAREQLTQTVYDADYSLYISDPLIGGKIGQRNLRNRVSYTLVKNLHTDSWHTNATFYTYDAHGNVDTLLQDYRGVSGLPSGSRFKRMVYRYDLISGKVNEVAYQPGDADAFYHRYQYDAENRITAVFTSRDKVYWEREAAYEYYRHGPLRRTVLGQQQVQGMDYAYTLQGWLKGVNSSSLLNGTKDMGTDGTAGSVVARDIYGFALHYYDNNAAERDYKQIGGADAFARPNNASYFRSLYNGNISAMMVNNKGLAKGGAATNALPLMYNYRYDQLNRITLMRTFKGLNDTSNVWTPALMNDYREDIGYDPNGNIKTYLRYGSPAISGKQVNMDSLTYRYYAGSNKLHYVDDTAPSGNYTEDIDDQSTGNYGYDSIGNLIKDNAEGITNIVWNVYGKIMQITKASGNIAYTYDAAGNRITKTAAGKTTLYVRDAGGNVMSLYEIPTANTISQKEIHLYGSSRLGMALPESKVVGTQNLASGFAPAKIRTLVRGEKIFELSNHLGNVLATITDKKIQVPKASPNQAQIDYYIADVVSAQDYYAFGMQMPGRSYTAPNGGYRYGFNGKENDNDVKGNGNQQDYGMRIYDPRLGKFLSVDPISAQYPELTPYQFASNTPIQAIDLDGLEAAVTTFTYATQKDAKVKVVDADLVVDYTKPRSETIKMVIEGMTFTANSYSTLEGRDDKNNFNGDFSNIRTLSSEDIAGIFGYADHVFDVIYQKNTKEHAVLYESGAGPLKNESGLLDFKNILYSTFNFKMDELIAIDGVAYNANEAGNYIWGMVLREAGVFASPKKIAEWGTKGRSDEPHEQKAIQSGMKKADSFKFNEKTMGIRNTIFKRYREEYYDYLRTAEGKEVYKPSDNLGIFKEGRERYGYE